MLTDKQRKRLAREMRKLAMECIDGTAPDFTVDSYCGCAVGTAIFRALGIRVPSGIRDAGDCEKYELAVQIDRHLPDKEGLGVASRALQFARYGSRKEQQAAVVFPLLALADEVEAFAERGAEKAEAALLDVHDALHGECDGRTDLPTEIRALRARAALASPSESVPQPTPDIESLKAALAELLRLYDWRFVLAEREKNPANETDKSFKNETRRLLNQYGTEKKAAWNAARAALARRSAPTPGYREAWEAGRGPLLALLGEALAYLLPPPRSAIHMQDPSADAARLAEYEDLRARIDAARALPLPESALLTQPAAPEKEHAACKPPLPDTWGCVPFPEKESVVGAVLRTHYLAGIDCDHEKKQDRARCACSTVNLPWLPSVGAAVESWIAHVEEVIATDPARGPPSGQSATPGVTLKDAKEGVAPELTCRDCESVGIGVYLGMCDRCGGSGAAPAPVETREENK